MPKYFDYVYEDPDLNTPFAYITCPGAQKEKSGTLQGENLISSEIRATQEVDGAIDFLIRELEEIRKTLKQEFSKE